MTVCQVSWKKMEKRKNEERKEKKRKEGEKMSAVSDLNYTL